MESYVANAVAKGITYPSMGSRFRSDKNPKSDGKTVLQDGARVRARGSRRDCRRPRELELSRIGRWRIILRDCNQLGTIALRRSGSSRSSTNNH